MTLSMRSHAVHIERYGSPEVLTYFEAEQASLAAHEIRIKTLAAAVNHTDLKIRAGLWPVRKPNPFPYVPGVETVGVIEEVGEAVHGWVPGQPVITMMQGLGGVRAERPGGYAEFVTVDADSVAPIPADVDPVGMAALGLVGVTAFHGLKKLGQIDGKRILITGAAGGIGSAATAIARVRGACVVGLISRADQSDYVRSLGADEVIVAARGKPPTLAPESIDGVLDAVAGDVFNACVQALRPGGVLCLVGAVGGGDVGLDTWQLIRPVSLTGYSTESLDGAALREAIDALAHWLRAQAIRPPSHQSMPLSAASRAHQLLEKGGVSGRVLLMP